MSLNPAEECPAKSAKEARWERTARGLACLRIFRPPSRDTAAKGFTRLVKRPFHTRLSVFIRGSIAFSRMSVEGEALRIRCHSERLELGADTVCRAVQQRDAAR